MKKQFFSLSTLLAIILLIILVSFDSEVLLKPKTLNFSSENST